LYCPGAETTNSSCAKSRYHVQRPARFARSLDFPSHSAMVPPRPSTDCLNHLLRRRADYKSEWEKRGLNDLWQMLSGVTERCGPCAIERRGRATVVAQRGPGPRTRAPASRRFLRELALQCAPVLRGRGLRKRLGQPTIHEEPRREGTSSDTARLTPPESRFCLIYRSKLKT
jgi:hypothetical protein